jgi:hypothetical protein
MKGLPMSSFPDHGINDPDIQAASAPGRPSAEALLAGTLALMTGHAQGCCEDHRALMTKKIIANLLMLSSHPEASSGFRAMVAKLHAMWIRLLQQGNVHPLADQPAHRDATLSHHPSQHRVLWHATSETLQ